MQLLFDIPYVYSGMRACRRFRRRARIRDISRRFPGMRESSSLRFRKAAEYDKRERFRMYQPYARVYIRPGRSPVAVRAYLNNTQSGILLLRDCDMLRAYRARRKKQAVHRRNCRRRDLSYRNGSGIVQTGHIRIYALFSHSRLDGHGMHSQLFAQRRHSDLLRDRSGRLRGGYRPQRMRGGCRHVSLRERVQKTGGMVFFRRRNAGRPSLRRILRSLYLRPSAPDSARDRRGSVRDPSAQSPC